MRDLYRVLNLRDKLESGQAVLEVRPTRGKFHIGEFGDVLRTQMVNITIVLNGYTICVAHRMVNIDGEPLTEPDPKFIRIDESEFRKEVDKS